MYPLACNLISSIYYEDACVSYKGKAVNLKIRCEQYACPGRGRQIIAA